MQYVLLGISSEALKGTSASLGCDLMPFHMEIRISLAAFSYYHTTLQSHMIRSLLSTSTLPSLLA